MKLLVLSDIHGEHYIMKQVLEREADADAIFFLGDGIRDVDVWQRANPQRKLYAVRGNCDYEQMWPLEGLAAFDGTLFFYTHGHEYGVKSTMSVIADAARARGADVVLYGHTHYPILTQQDGIRFFNPGSLSFSLRINGPCYGVITTAPGGKVEFEHKTI